MKIAWSFLFGMMVWGCAKKPPIATSDIKYIIAGDSTGSYVHYSRIKDTVGLYLNNNLDIDHDNTPDLYFISGVNHTDPAIYNFYFTVTPNNQNDQVFVCVDKYGYPRALNNGDTINNSVAWSDASGLAMYIDGYFGRPDSAVWKTFGNWLANIHQGYMGFKIIKKSETIWGWVSIGDSGSSYYLVSDAYTEY